MKLLEMMEIKEMRTMPRDMPGVEQRGVLGQPLAPWGASISMEEPVPCRREELVPSPAEATGSPQQVAPTEADSLAAGGRRTSAPLPRPEPTTEDLRELAAIMVEENPESVLDPEALVSAVRAFYSDQQVPADITAPVLGGINQIRRRWADDPEQRKAAMRSWLVLRFTGFQEGRLPFPALKAVRDLALSIFGAGIANRDIGAVRSQVLGSWAVDLRYLTQLQNEMNQLGVQVDCAQLVKEGKLHAVESNGSCFTSKVALLEYFATLPDPAPEILALLAAHASPEAEPQSVSEPATQVALEPEARVTPESEPPTAPEPEPQAIPQSEEMSELPMTTKQGWPGLYPEVTAAIRAILDRTEDGDAFTSGDVVPLVQDAYERKHGREPDRHVIQVVLAGKLKAIEQAGHILLAEGRKGIGGHKTWLVVKPQEAEPRSEALAAPPAPPVALAVQPEQQEQQPEPTAIGAVPDGERPDPDSQPVAATVVLEEARPGTDPLVEEPLPQEGQPAPAQRLADLEAAHEQDQITIAALRQRVATLEDELRLARGKGSLAEFFAQVRESKMRIVVEAR